MEIDEIINFIEHIYESINIYHTIILYSSLSSIDNLNVELKEKDFPVEVYTGDQNVEDMEYRSRVIILDVSYIDKYITEKNNDLSDITVFVCMDKDSDTILHEKINKEVRFSEKMYIFSCIKV